MVTTFVEVLIASVWLVGVTALAIFAMAAWDDFGWGVSVASGCAALVLFAIGRCAASGSRSMRPPFFYRLLNALRSAVEDWEAGDVLVIEQLKRMWRRSV